MTETATINLVSGKQEIRNKQITITLISGKQEIRK